MSSLSFPTGLLLLVSAPFSAQQSCFDGSGGPNGDFNWVVHSGEVFFLDTTFTAVVGGPGGVPAAVQNCVDGVIDLRNLVIEEGAEIRVDGPNRMLVLATGDVIIRGALDLSGFHARDVPLLSLGDDVQFGAAGCAGGGSGGNGNPIAATSPARGDAGAGPFGGLASGGGGGESSYGSTGYLAAGDGGGGRLARDQGAARDGLAGTAGDDGDPLGIGALSGMSPALGGAAGSGPFVDGKAINDFFGVRPLLGGRGELIGLLRGELSHLWPGYGGGGGGNAIPSETFPPAPGSLRDAVGAGGGGGGGALHVQALGRIVFGARGTILSDGGRGGRGENPNFLDPAGGNGGGGSGGHVVLESASEIDFTDGGANTAVAPRDWLSAIGGLSRGGLASGSGGPGIVQLHVPDPVAQPGTNPAMTDIVVPAAAASARNPLDQVASPGAIALFLTCDPLLRPGHSWFGLGGRGAVPDWVRMLPVRVVPESRRAEVGLVLDGGLIEVPRRF